MSHIERNYEIIQEKMIEQMEHSLKFGKSLIDAELDAGLFNFLVKPVVKSFYDYWSKNDAKEGTLQQIEATLDCGRKIVKNGISEDEKEKVIEEYFPKYLKGDQTYRQCKKNHKDFNELKRITKDCFITQVEEVVKFLKVKSEVDDYDDLTKSVYQSKQEALDALNTQLRYNDAGIKIVEEDPSILKVPTGKNIIIKVLRKGFIESKKELLGNLERIYN
ncbi:MAG: hypothetical protein R6U96_11070 [Promethearchaeia archaeon]